MPARHLLFALLTILLTVLPTACSDPEPAQKPSAQKPSAPITKVTFKVDGGQGLDRTTKVTLVLEQSGLEVFREWHNFPAGTMAEAIPAYYTVLLNKAKLKYVWRRDSMEFADGLSVQASSDNPILKIVAGA